MSLKGSSHKTLFEQTKSNTVFVQQTRSSLEKNFNKRVLSFVFAQVKNSLLGFGSVGTASGV